MARTGRRPGKTDTQGRILSAARHQFAERGYTGATIRGIAADAGVDPALVLHYFADKRALFVAAVQLPFDPMQVFRAVVDGDPGAAGERMARMLLRIWSTEQGRITMQSLLRSALTDDEVLRMMREFMLETVLGPAVRQLAPDHHRLRAGLLASQVIGLAIVRYVARVEPLASAADDEIVAAIAPSLQRYLTGDVSRA